MENLLGWMGWALAALGLTWKLFGDRFGIERRLAAVEGGQTTIAVEVEGMTKQLAEITEAIRMIADQNTQIAVLRQRVDGHCETISDHADRIKALEKGGVSCSTRA